MVNYPSFGVWFVGVDIPKELIKLLEVVDNSKWRQEQRWPNRARVKSTRPFELSVHLVTGK